jgi:ferritin-like metal-binding protein YciE
MRLGGHRCEAMDGIIEEGEEILKMDATPEARDAALIAASQRVEHYEIAAYGSARTFARMLGEDKAAALLEQTLQEEEEADRKLSALAEQNVNRAAMAAHT